MTGIPFVFKNTIRDSYFNLLKRSVENEGLSLDLGNFKEDVILFMGYLKPSIIVAIVDSHSKWGEPDDLTNEITPRGLNRRTYGGLKIIIVDIRYRRRIEKIADFLKRNLEEDVVIEEASVENSKVYGDSLCISDR